MTTRGRDEAARALRWAELQRSARAVRALPAGDDPDSVGDPSHHRVIALSVAAATGLGGAALGIGAGAPLSVYASTGSFNSELLAYTNQDRTSNGVGALQLNTTLADIADGRPFSCSGGVANGRAIDMIQRDYFDHPIPECGGQLADIMLTPDGIRWTAWGENIAWESGGAGAPCDPSTSVAVQMNCMYMNSPEHRANILNPSYNQFGSAFELGTNYQGSSNAWLSVEEFIQGSGGSGGGGAPAPTPRPVPVRTPRPVVPPVRVPVPVPLPLVQAPAPAPAATPAPAPTPAPTPPPFVPVSLAPVDGTGATAGTVPPAVAPLLYTPQGLLSDSVEAVLEGHLLD